MQDSRKIIYTMVPIAASIAAACIGAFVQLSQHDIKIEQITDNQKQRSADIRDMNRSLQQLHTELQVMSTRLDSIHETLKKQDP